MTRLVFFFFFFIYLLLFVIFSLRNGGVCVGVVGEGGRQKEKGKTRLSQIWGRTSDVCGTSAEKRGRGTNGKKTNPHPRKTDVGNRGNKAEEEERRQCTPLCSPERAQLTQKKIKKICYHLRLKGHRGVVAIFFLPKSQSKKYVIKIINFFERGSVPIKKNKQIFLFSFSASLFFFPFCFVDHTRGRRRDQEGGGVRMEGLLDT